MDEWNPVNERLTMISSTFHGFVQRSRRLPIIRPLVVPEQLLVDIPCDIRRKPITDRPHRPNDTAVTCKQHSCRNMNGLVGEILVTCRCLACGEKGKATTRTRQGDNVRYFQAAFVGETESTARRTRGILDTMTREMDPVYLLHQSEYFFDCSDGGFQEGNAC